MDYNNFYDYLQSMNKQRNQEKFNAFMLGLESGLTNDLDKLYADGNMIKYKKIVDNLKSKGIRVFRNTYGKHKIKMF